MARFHTAAWRRLFYTSPRHPLVVGATCADAAGRCTPWRCSSRYRGAVQVSASECVVVLRSTMRDGGVSSKADRTAPFNLVEFSLVQKNWTEPDKKLKCMKI